MRAILLSLCGLVLTASLSSGQNLQVQSNNQNISTAAKQDDQTALLTTIDADTGGILAATETAASLLAAIEAALVPDAIFDNPALTTGPQIMGYGSAATPSAASADGDAVRIWTDLVGRIHAVTEGVEDAAETAAAFLSRVGTVRRDTAASSADTTGDNATLNTDSLGRLWITGSAVEDAGETAGGILNMIGTVRRDTAASSAGTTADNATLNTDSAGLLWTRQFNPCTSMHPTTVPISVAADTAVVSASASNYTWICGGTLVSSAAEVVSIWEGTGTACGTSSAALVGSTTEANGMSFAANGGTLVIGPVAGISTNVDICIRLSSTNRVAGFLSVVQVPY